jgi:hypothetical protein
MSFFPFGVQVTLAGDPVPLKRISISIPKGHDLAGLSFVLRSGDSSMWWRDGTSLLDSPDKQVSV